MYDVTWWFVCVCDVACWFVYMMYSVGLRVQCAMGFMCVMCH